MKNVIFKTLFIIATIVLISLIMLVSCARPVHNQQAELDVVLAYCEPDTQRQSIDFSGQQTVIESEKEPETLASAITQSPENFLAYFKAHEIDAAQRILLTDELLTALKVFQREQYEALDEQDDELFPVVPDILLFMDRAVGGHYIFGSQGDVLTTQLINSTNQIHPDYLTAGRLEYFIENAVLRGFKGHTISPVYPRDYAWDCSGLWWDCINTLELFDRYTDRTAMQTFEDFCTPITKEELRPGDLVFYRLPEGRISHMGIVGYDRYIYEAASGFVGVIKTQSLDLRVYEDVVRGGHLIFPLWNEFGRPNFYK